MPAAESPKPRGISRQEREAGSIRYVRKSDPQVPVPIVLSGIVAVAAAIILFLHFFRS